MSRRTLLPDREGESNYQQHPLKRSFSGFQKSQTRGDGVGRFDATQHAGI